MTIPHPTLVIGLGGTGQWVASHVLKELVELYGLRDPNQLNPRVRILAVDTDFKNVAAVGFGQRSEMGGVTVGQVTLPATMRVPIGANVHSYVEQIANGQYPETGAWFDARWFLGQPNYATLLNLVNGAGQFRPLGRLAVPYNLCLGEQTLRTALTNAINAIKNQMNKGESLIVCLAGSLCGGTGAGMFVDVAHLVQTIASPTPVLMRGYLVLPHAFEGTVPPSPDAGTEFRRRAFAAMRELRRFSRELDYEVGYPMFYAGPERQTDGVLRGRLNKTLFDLLYYFDAGLTRVEVQKTPGGRESEVPVLAKVEDGIAPLIAEAILLWVDGETAPPLLSHTTNLTARKVAKVAGGQLSPQAAVAGGLGVFSLQLPLYHIIDEWTHDLGRKVLRRFLAVPEEGGEDVTTKTVIRLRDDWAGGAAGPSGQVAARADWLRGQVGGIGLIEFVKDLLKTGIAGREGGGAEEKRERELRARPLDEWHEVLAPSGGASDEDRGLITEFLYPQEVVLERGGVLNRPTKVRKAHVLTTAHLPGHAKRDEKRTPSLGAQRVKGEANSYLDTHLGSAGLQTKVRGGSDREPEGQYPTMLRRWMQGHVEQFRTVLRAWVAQALNGTGMEERTTGETVDTAIRNRAGKLGYTLALLGELTQMLNESEQALRQLEYEKLGTAVSLRESTQITELVKKMEKNTGAQANYLVAQQELLEAERLYAAVRATRWSVGQIHTFTKSALDSLEAWKEVLTKELYQTVWKGQEQIATNLAEMEKLGAVRQIVNLPATKSERYRYYAEKQKNAIGEILNDFRWQVAVSEVYDPARAGYVPALTIGLELGQDNRLSLEGAQSNARNYVDRCRAVFADAREYETLLGWLTDYYDASTDARNITALAQDLNTKGRLALRYQPGANPYKFAYVRAQWKNDFESGWLRGLLTNLTTAAGVDALHSQVVSSSDPCRLAFLAFNELIDVEALDAYVEGRDGVGGAGGYIHLPARSDSTALSRQVLHVFSAERNAAVYEERLGRLLPDRIVALLEDRDRFRQFVQAWAYGKLADAQEVLINTVRLPDDHHQHGGKWVRQLTTGPFEGEIDRHTGLPRPAEHRWLTEPAPEQPALTGAAEAFLLRGSDKWQVQGTALLIDHVRVQREISRRQAVLAQQATLGEANPTLKRSVDRIVDEDRQKRARLKLADYEHLQRLQGRLKKEFVPEAERGIQDWRSASGADSPQKAQKARLYSETELDVDLLKVMREFIADEMAAIRRDIQQQQSLTSAESETSQATETLSPESSPTLSY